MRVVIADDSVLWREGLALLLEEAGVDVVALVGDADADADALQEAVSEHLPDVAIIDVRMPPAWTHEGAQAVDALGEYWSSSADCCCPRPLIGVKRRPWPALSPAASGTCSRTASSMSPPLLTPSAPLAAAPSSTPRSCPPCSATTALPAGWTRCRRGSERCLG